MNQNRALRGQRLFFPGLQTRGLELPPLELQELRPARSLALCGHQLVPFPAECLPMVVVPPIRDDLRERAGKRVHEFAVPPGIQERLAEMLSVYVNQGFGERPKGGGRGKPAADIGLALPVAQQVTAEDQKLPRLDGDPFRVQRGAGGGGDGQVEGRFHHRLIGPRAQQVFAAPRPQHELEGVDEDGFPRPRLAGEDVQARNEGDRQGVDDRHVLDGELAEHADHLSPVRVLRGDSSAPPTGAWSGGARSS